MDPDDDRTFQVPRSIFNRLARSDVDGGGLRFIDLLLIFFGKDKRVCRQHGRTLAVKAVFDESRYNAWIGLEPYPDRMDSWRTGRVMPFMHTDFKRSFGVFDRADPQLQAGSTRHQTRLKDAVALGAISDL